MTDATTLTTTLRSSEATENRFRCCGSLKKKKSLRTENRVEKENHNRANPFPHPDDRFEEEGDPDEAEDHPVPEKRPKILEDDSRRRREEPKTKSTRIDESSSRSSIWN